MGAREIPLTQGYVTIVDDCDYAMLSQFSWFAVVKPSTVYAVRRGNDGGKRPWIRLHRFLANPGPGQVVDHIDGDGLNNTRANLRVCSAAENTRNQRRRSPKLSPYKGVYPCWSRWEARICAERRRIRLGRFDCPIEAARAYDAAARRYHGEFAHLNFPEAK